MSAPPIALRSQAAAVDTQPIQDIAHFVELRSEWFDLWSGIPDSTVFQSPDWLIPWWAQYGDGAMLSFAFRCDGRLVGLAPLYIYEDTEHRTRNVLLIGTGNSDYLDIVVHPEFKSVCWTSVLRELERRSNVWDECDFQQLRSCSSLVQAAGEMGRLKTQLQQDEPCPVLDVHSPLSFPIQKKAKYYRRRLENSGTFQIEEATPDSFGEIFDALEHLHGQRWRARGVSGVLSAECDREFHRCAARAFLNSKMLRLYGARLNGKIIAALYAFCSRRRTYFYLSGFDPEYAHFSIGTVILAHAIEAARRHGCELFDFLRGQEAYKYRWGAADQPTFRRRFLKRATAG